MYTSDPKAYYTQPGVMTNPGPYSELFDPLPSDPAALCMILHGVMALDLWVDFGVLQVPEERRQEWNIRSVESKLRRILESDTRPLTVARPFEQRLLGNCRDTSLLLCAILRHHGIPARVRAGFALWQRERRVDHWVCEYWKPDEQRWVMVDAFLDQVRHKQELLPQNLRVALADLGCDPPDVRATHFITGGKAWQRCRMGEDDPNHYGITGDLWGLWFIRDNMLRDLLALNKIEVLPWDHWGMISNKRDDPTPAELTLLDYIAEMTQVGDVAFTEIRKLYEQAPSLHLPTLGYRRYRMNF